MISSKVYIDEVPAFELVPDLDEIQVNLGTLDGPTLRVDPRLSLVVTLAGADKARQIGALLIGAAEQIDPTGLELVRSPDLQPEAR